jgi:hypothetical protein
VLRVCAHVQQAGAGSGITALRVLLVADLLARTAELTGLQVLTALEISGPLADQAAALESDAGALVIHPPAARTGFQDAPSSLGGPIDVHLLSQGAGLDQASKAARPAAPRLRWNWSPDWLATEAANRW